MPRIEISQLDDPRIATYRQLKRTNETRWREDFIVEGEKLFDRLRESRYPLLSVLTTERHLPRIEARIPPDLPCYVVAPELISVIVGFNFHQGVLACGGRRPWPDLAALVSQAGPSTWIVCPELNNPENLGSMIRIGDVFGVDGVLVGGACPDPLSRRVLRVSMGTSLALPVVVSEDLETELARLELDWGHQFLATVVDRDAEPLDELKIPERLGLFMGTESQGLAPHWVRRCHRRVTIPMRPGAESLNVSVAAGILLYGLSRRRTASL